MSQSFYSQLYQVYHDKKEEIKLKLMKLLQLSNEGFNEYYINIYKNDPMKDRTIINNRNFIKNIHIIIKLESKLLAYHYIMKNEASVDGSTY